MAVLRQRFRSFYQAYIRGCISTLGPVAVILVLSMWMRAGYPAFGIWAPHDDALFVSLADKINSLKWLGSFNQLTLAKGAFFPIFLSVVDVTGLPLKLVEHFLYLLSALLFAYVVKRASGNRPLFFLLFAILAFSPVPWMFEGGARVTREPLYLTLTLLVFALAALLFIGKDQRESTGKALGVIAACFWLTREEGVWLLPALAVLALSWGMRLAKSFSARDKTRLASQAAILAVPVIAFLAIVILVNSMNWAKYGVFRNNDLRSGPFAAAYGALARIQPDQWQRFVVAPSDARRLAYSVSPAAKELEAYLEGPQGKAWTKSSHGYPDPWGCVGQPDKCSSEILSAWFLWAFRDAVASAGHYRSAIDADAYYERLAREVNQACDQARIPCDERRDSLVPRWRDQYWLETLAASEKVLRTLVSLNQGHVGVPPSVMMERQEWQFTEIINQELSGKQDGSGSFIGFRISLTSNIAKVYAFLSPPMFYAAIAIHLLLLVTAARVKYPSLPSGSMILLTALLVAVATRVVLLGFLEATSIPSNNLLYLLPAVPLYLAYVVMSFSFGVLVFVGLIRRPSGPAS